MADFYLDLRDKPRVVDFLVEVIPFADEHTRLKASELVKSYQNGERVPTDKLAEVARKIASSTWPARYAVAQHFLHEGAEEEWKTIIEAIRPSTALILKRFRQSTGAKTLDEVLKHDEARSAVHDEEAQEISNARAHFREVFWKGKESILDKIVKNGERERDGYIKRFKKLRDIAEGLPQVLQDEVFSKMRHYEDRIMFAGEVVSMEILDEEIKYYTEQKEISPLEG